MSNDNLTAAPYGLDMADELNRLAEILDFLIDSRMSAGRDASPHPGESWILGEILDGIRKVAKSLHPAAMSPTT